MPSDFATVTDVDLIYARIRCSITLKYNDGRDVYLAAVLRRAEVAVVVVLARLQLHARGRRSRVLERPPHGQKLFLEEQGDHGPARGERFGTYVGPVADSLETRVGRTKTFASSAW